MSIDEKFWDFDKNKPKRNCPNKEAIEKLITSKLSEYNDLIITMTTERKEYTTQTLAQVISNKVQSRTVVEMYNLLIDEMRKSERLGNLEVYKYSRNSLLNFTRNKLDISFGDIDTNWLKKYESWLDDRECKDTTKSQLFRTLRSVFNKAIEQGIIKQDCYPFNRYKLAKFDLKTQKRAITKEEVQKIIALNLSGQSDYMRLARDMFLFSYFSAGINFVDSALITIADINEGRIQYIRKKTKKTISIPLCDITNSIISKYITESNCDTDYIFPILNKNVHTTELQKRNRVHKCLGHINLRLKDIGEMIGLKTPLTTYVARHTFATVLKRSGVNIAIISESLGHSDLATTQIYLDSFENSQIDAAMQHLL
jgi:site-specific recombinase XerD